MLVAFPAAQTHAGTAAPLYPAPLRQMASDWIGQYPDHGKHHLLSDRAVAALVGKVIEPETLRKIKGFRSGDYLEDTIDFLKGYYILNYTYNNHRNSADQTILIFIKQDLRCAHAAVIERPHAEEGKEDAEAAIVWRHYGEAEPPKPIVDFVSVQP
jgi:hypothetical protein